MIATTISNSIREKPFCFFMMLDLLRNFMVPEHTVPIASRGPMLRPWPPVVPYIVMD
jgi:hypothetical protein